MEYSNPNAEEDPCTFVFGRPPIVEDWLRDIRVRLKLVLMDLSPAEIQSVLERRLAERSSWSGPNLEKIQRTLDSRTEGFLSEVYLLREGLERVSSIKNPDSSGTIIEAFYSDLELEADEVAYERDWFVTELKALRTAMDPRVAPRVSTVQRLIEQGLSEVGAERSNLLREARTILTDLIANDNKVHPAIWLYYGLVVWELTQDSTEAVPVFANAANHPTPTIAGFLCFRLLTYFAYREEQHARAFDCAKRAVEIRPSADACAEAALCASAMHDPTSAKSMMESAISVRAGVIVAMLSDERVIPVGSDLLEVAVRIQMSLRRGGRQFVTNWADAAKVVTEAQRVCGAGIQVSHELMEGHKLILAKLEKADLITAGYLTRSSEQNSKDVLETAKESLALEQAKRVEALDTAKLMVESAASNRDNLVEAARKWQSNRVIEAKEATRKAMIEAERTQNSAILGLGSGCGLFALYIASYVVLSGRGQMIGLNTPVGLCSMIVSGIPVVIAIFFQISYGVKRMTLEADLNDSTKAASQGYEAASKEADDVYREQLAQGRKALDAADIELRKADGAVRVLAKSSTDGAVNPRLARKAAA